MLEQEQALTAKSGLSTNLGKSRVNLIEQTLTLALIRARQSARRVERPVYCSYSLLSVTNCRESGRNDFMKQFDAPG